MSLSKERVVALAEWWRYTVHTIMSVTQCDHTTSGVRSAWYLTVISSPHSTPAPDHPGSNLAPGLQRSAFRSRLSVYTATALAEKNEQLFMCEDNSSLIISKRLVTVAECRPKALIYRHLMSDDCPTARLSLSLSPTPGSILAPAYRALIVRHSVPSAVDLAEIFHENLNSGDHFTMSQTRRKELEFLWML